MPIPMPSSNESKDEFISRCAGIMSHVEKDMDPKQRVAICYSQWEKHQKHNSEFLRKVELLNGQNIWTRLKDFLLIEKAELLGPGTWTGMDGIPTTYSESVIKSANMSILGKPIKITHADNAETVVGFWDAVKDVDGKTLAQGIVWHPVGVKYFEEHPNSPLSIEADAQCQFDALTKTDVVLAMTYNGGAAVENPAYPSGGVEQQRHITLSARIELSKTDGKTEKGKENNMDQNWDKIELSEQEKAALNQPFFSDKSVKMTRSEAIAFFMTQLQNAKVPEDKAEYFNALMSKTLANDFPLTIVAPTTPAAKPEDVAVPTQPITTEPKPDEALIKKIEQLESELAKTNSALNARLDEDISNTVTSIKTIDNSFDSAKFLEGITEKTLQKKMLASHFEGLKRVRPEPIIIKLSSDDAKKKANEASKSMFGIDLETLFKQTTSGGKQ